MSEARYLTLVRHAKSSWMFGDLDDFRRPLNKRGLKDCQKVPGHLEGRLPAPQVVLCSDAVRAVQTCQAVVDALGVPEEAVRLDHALYLAGAPTILDIVGRVDPAVTELMVIGHNPGLTDTYNYLSPRPVDNIPTFGVARLGFDARAWDALGESQARPLDYIVPRSI